VGAGARVAAAAGLRRLRLAALVCLMVALPIAAVSWLGARSMRTEQERLRLRLAQAAGSALEGVAATVRERIDADARELGALLDALPSEIGALRRVGRSQRLVRQLFLVEPGGELRYPAEGSASSSRELEFLQRTRALWEQGLLSGGDPSEEGGEAGRGVWQSWVWGTGTSFLYWRRQPDGSVRGAEVEGSALVADVIGALPETPADAASAPEGASVRVTLAGADGAVVYQWGSHQPAELEAPLASRRLQEPLAGWSLSYFAPGEVGGSGGARTFAVVASVVALALLLAGAGVYVWRETGREAREALRRVSFVNQVSHELKSPLTNIRLYAELMAERLEEGGGRLPAEERAALASRLEVIVDESRRLSRLVHNVLSFARRDRGTLEVRRSPGMVDEIIRSVLADFAPSLQEKGVAVELDCPAGGRVWLDADALEQILANLVGNVEKYASGGGYLGIRSRRLGEATEIRVSDRGPGIPASQRERVFEPFYRISNRLSDGVAGTGIGLTIARELARLHGGDLRLAEPEAGQGAELVVTLLTPPCEEES
jgi:signal transduction histidine kinase